MFFSRFYSVFSFSPIQQSLLVCIFNTKLMSETGETIIGIISNWRKSFLDIY